MSRSVRCLRKSSHNVVSGYTKLTKANSSADISPSNIATATGVAVAMNGRTLYGLYAVSGKEVADTYNYNTRRTVIRIKKVVFDGTETFTVSYGAFTSSTRTNTVRFIDNTRTSLSGDYRYGIISTHFPYLANNYATDAQGVSYMDSTGNCCSFSINRTDIPNYTSTMTDSELLAAFKSWLAAQYSAGTPVTVWYRAQAENIMVGYKNLISGGNFPSTTSAWSAYGAETITSISNNILTTTGTNAATGGGAITIANTKLIAGHKYYYNTVQLKVNNSSASRVRIELYSDNKAGSVLFVQGTEYTNPIADTWYKLSSVNTVTTQTDYIRLQFYHSYADAATHSSKVLSAKNAGVYDLTAIFGAGNEPTLAWCDANIVPPYIMFIDSYANLATNPKFLNGTAGWSPNLCTLSASSGILTCTLTGTSGNYGIYQTLSTTIATGNKVYIRCDIKPKYTGTYRIGLNDSNTAGAITADVWNTVSTIVTKASYNITVFYANSSSYAVGDVIYFKNCKIYDLTALFGAGNEPDKTWCDQYLGDLESN
ncbi:MAG: hypothetical protein N2171_04930 [Clostridia bacterium]|nr:hypothetical protein [Clostridia bacterium]